MFDHILAAIQAKIRALNYVMTIHAEEEMDNDELSIFDVEQAILVGDVIERQKDRNSEEWKYLIQGTSDAGETIVVVVKLSPTDTVVIITVYTL